MILFDLDGTLVDSAVGIAAALTQLSVRRGGKGVTPATVRPLVALGADVLVGSALGPVAGDGAADLADFRAILMTMPADPAALYPGAVDCLDTLAERGLTMAVVTNKPEGLARKLLEDLGMIGRFAAVVGGDTLPRAKPAPDPLFHALALGGYNRQSCAVMIGDSGTDGRAAQAAGMPFVLFTGGYGARECDALPVAARFSHFSQAATLIEDALSVAA